LISFIFTLLAPRNITRIAMISTVKNTVYQGAQRGGRGGQGGRHASSSSLCGRAVAVAFKGSAGPVAPFGTTGDLQALAGCPPAGGKVATQA